MPLQRLDRIYGQHGAERQAEIGCTPHLRNRSGDGERQPLSAIFFRTRQSSPAAGDERLHDAIFQPRSFAIAAVIQRCKHVFCEVRSLVENGADRCRHLIAGQRRNRSKIGYVFQDETHIIDGRCIGDHGRRLQASRSGRARPAPSPGAVHRRM